MNWKFLELAARLPEKARIILQVHDSVVVECPERLGEEVRQLMVDAMTTDMVLGGHRCLFTVDAKIGRTWAEV